MSMLAERKRKQKWSLNPRGKDWSQDVNKFGQKMLEKMGWQQGKGLGANEDGITEHVKVSYKNDSKGMGYKESSDQWTEHETNFSALLESLSGKTENFDEIKPKSLEKKSQISRARVHYHKFTRGKDLSRYSEKDLANIFGKKSLKESKKEEIKVEPVTSNIEKLENDSRFHIHAGSMRDYFKKKLPNFGKGNGYVVGSNGVLKKEDSDSESEIRPSFGFNNKRDSDLEESNQYAGFGFKSEDKELEQKPSFVSYIKEENCTENGKKKKKRKMDESNEGSSPKKKSKSEGLSNPAFNPLYTPVKVQKHVLEPIDESISEENSVDEENPRNTLEVEAEVYEEASKTDLIDSRLKKKKKNKGVMEENAIEVYNESTNEKIMNISVLSEGGKKKKKKNVEIIEENAIGVCNWSLKEEYTSITNGESQTIELKITKKKKKNILAVDNPNSEELSQDSVDCLQTEENPYEVQVKDKKKKKKERMAVENPTFNESVEESTDFSQIEENPYEVRVPVKKKKKKTKLAIENPSFNDLIEDSVDISQSEDNPHEVKRKKSKKSVGEYLSSLEEIVRIEERQKKKKKREETALDNPGFDISIEESSISSQTEENPYEVKNKKKKKKSILEQNNPGFDLSADNSVGVSRNEENPYEVKKKKKKEDRMALENPAFSLQDTPQSEESSTNGAFEVKRKKKKKKKAEEENGISNPALNLDTSSSEIKESISLNVEEGDLMLNIVSTPVVTTPKTVNSGDYNITKVSSVKRRKSVRFSDVTEERIIPNNEELRNLSAMESDNELFEINAQVLNGSLEDQDRARKRKLGLDNAAFDEQQTSLEENVDTISKTLDRYQAEIENDINERKLEVFTMDDVMVGEVGNPHGENEKLPDGTRLKFKYANFTGKPPGYHLDKVGAKKSYRHLIKGDIVLKFNNTNLHQIDGYAVKGRSAVV